MEGMTFWIDTNDSNKFFFLFKKFKLSCTLVNAEYLYSLRYASRTHKYTSMDFWLAFFGRLHLHLIQDGLLESLFLGSHPLHDFPQRREGDCEIS